MTFLMYCKLKSEIWLIIFGILVAIQLRCCTMQHPYSGMENPPMYGDYEAQRHWMEITTNLPINQWYYNTTDNNLEYWGLDYPPLTAYHMYLCGRIASLIDSRFTRLFTSRGFESDTHKLFMRSSVLLGDILLYFPAVILYYYACYNLEKKHELKCETSFKSRKIKNKHPVMVLDPSLCIVIALLYPGIILIDHGHFQYNSISLGLFIFSVATIILGKNILATILFCLALNYKQMELYHSLPFFFYLLSTCVPKPSQTALSGFITLAKIGITVILTFILLWLPFLLNINDLLQVLHRQFPMARGVFEDKVSNIWCTVNVFFKIKNHFDNQQMLRICLFSTLSAVLPSSVDLFLRPSLKKFVLAVINSSLSFFLFSFQVHEKSILLVAIPVLMYLPYSPVACFWFLCISVFSMTPLLIKDNLVTAVVALTAFFIISFQISYNHIYKNNLNDSESLVQIYHRLVGGDSKAPMKLNARLLKIFHRCIQNLDDVYQLFLHMIMSISLFGCAILFVCSLFLEPPEMYPDLYPLLISVYSCIHFIGFFLYFNVKQIRLPHVFDDVKL